MSTNRMVAWADKRLPRAEILSVPQVSAALNLRAEGLQALAESGEIDGFDSGSGGKASWQLLRVSVLEWIERRSMGLRGQAKRRLPQQEQLFQDGGTVRK